MKGFFKMTDKQKLMVRAIITAFANVLVIALAFYDNVYNAPSWFNYADKVMGMAFYEIGMFSMLIPINSDFDNDVKESI